MTENNGGPMKALIVDDDDLMCVMLGQAVAGMGLRVEEAKDGESALGCFEDVKPDLVLLDLNLPGINGLDVCRNLRARADGRSVPIVIVSGEDTREAIEASFAAGATYFVAKPIDWPLLGHRLRFVMQSSATLNELELSRGRLRQAQRLARLGSFECNIDRDRLRVSQNLGELLGLAIGEDARFADLAPAFEPPEWRRVLTLVDISRTNHATQTCELFSRQRRWFRLQLEVSDGNGTDVLRGTLLDIHDLRAAQDHAAYLARHDPLTGLLNRAGFTAALEADILHAGDERRILALLVIGLDRMRRCRESFGHAVADAVLLQTVDRLRRVAANIQPPPLLGRLGTDEIAVLIPQAGSSEDVAREAGMLTSVLEIPLDADGQPFYLQASGGIALYPTDGKDADDLVKAGRAALAMPDDGSRTLHFYDAGRDRTLAERMRLEDDLRDAVARGELFLHYQPLIRVTDRRPVGVEALLRWQHASRGNVPPVEFIPIAEESGQIHDIGAWVIREACRQAVRWQQAGIELDEIAVNVSGLQFRDASFAEKLAGILAETDLPPSRLVLELTESVLFHDDEIALTQLRRLKKLGVRLALDDFGTGFSSMVSLTRLPLDVVKVDRSFVQAAPHSVEAAAIVEAIVTLARRLGMETVAEGVEDAQHFDYLRQLGCSRAQGYLFARPQAAAGITDGLRAGGNLGEVTVEGR